MLAGVVTVLQGAVSTPVHALTSDLAVDVTDADSLAPITNFKYIINVDNTGTTEQRTPADGCSPDTAGYPATCHWTTAGIQSSAPIFTQGTQDDFPIADLPDGRYLISVIADGYKLDGAHFTMPLGDGETVPVKLQQTANPDPNLSPQGLPDATIQAAVFEDISPTNSAPDIPAEHGLAGFTGSMNDYLGTLITDTYGNPLCTTYDAAGNAVVASGGNCFSYCYVIDNGLDIGIVLPEGGSAANNVGQCPTDPTGLKMFALPAYANPADARYDHPNANSAYDVDVPSTATIEGKIIIPHLGTNRYALSVTQPNGTDWVQTTTLEGNHDWDAWVMEGATGLDTEFTQAGEPFPAIIFGYVSPNHTNGLNNPNTYGVDGSSAGKITGVVDAVKVYVPAVGGLPNNAGAIWGGVTGSKIDKPIDQPWLSLSNLGNGDTSVWIGQGNADGTFTIPHVPDGTYTLAWWDQPQDYIMDIQNITVVNGETINTGVLPLQQWWTQYDGYVFNDTNRDGKMEWNDVNQNGCPDGGVEGEAGVPNYGLTMRKRENSLMDRGTTTVGTDNCGHYYFESAYPMTQWLVMEAYNDLYYTTGVTYQADNQPTPTTVLGAGVDVSTLPIIGLSGRMDWGVHSYDANGTNGVDPQNGGIVGTVSYDTTRNELDPRYAAVEDWQPGVSGLTVDLYAPVDCPLDGVTPCDPTGRYVLNADGSYMNGPLLNTYVTETWSMPGANNNANGDGECIPRDVDGNVLAYPTGQGITKAPYTDCLEAPLMGIQFQKGFSAVDGNYGFGSGCLDARAPFDPTTGLCVDGLSPDDTPLAGGRDYLVHVEIPDDAKGKPEYQFTKEEDINIANGDPWVPQLPPPPCAGALHTVDVAGAGADPTLPAVDNYPAAEFGLDADGLLVKLPDPSATTGAVVTVPASTPVDNATFVGIGASPYDGQAKPVCDTKLVQVNNGKSIVPTFNVFTDVPLPARFWGLVVDDLNFSTNKQQINYGEKAGVPFVPVGIYDYTNRLIYTTESDYGGLFDVLMPSTNRISCPTPSGVCANLYRFVGNDPGVPGQLNANFNPLYRTIAAEFEAFPGLIVPADLAPTQVGVNVQLPGGQVMTPVSCPQETSTPQLFAVNRPYVGFPAPDRTLTIQGLGFGAAQGTGTVTLDGTSLGVATSWIDTAITITVPTSIAPGPHQLAITATNGRKTVSGLTFHVIGSSATTPFPTLGVLDDFNRVNAFTLGTNWSQIVLGGQAALRTNTNQAASVLSFGNYAYWNAPALGSTQGAAFTLANSPVNGSSLILKATGGSATAPQSFIRVRTVTTNPGSVVVETTSNAGFGAFTNTGTFASGGLASGDTITAVANTDGSVDVWKTTGTTTTHLGRSNAAAGFVGGGRIGMQLPNVARVDNFAGGNVTSSAGASPYNPNVYEVGPNDNLNHASAQPGHWFTPANTLPAVADHAVQNAIDAAAASPGDDLVVVYPGLATPTNSRMNPRGAYFENVILNAPVKLQGVGPGGFQGANSVSGTILDGSAFGGDSAVASDWDTTVAALTWSGNQTVNDGAIVTVYAQQNGGRAFGAFKASVDGFDLRGGDQQGFPTNINAIGGGATGLPGTIVTQGGAVFANAYAKNLQITNNTVEHNGGGYGTIRIGTPDVGDNQNDNVRIANNRIIANGGTNLAGGIGLFAGAENYEVAGNDICGNFSAEYGGGISHFGLSPGGKIHDNRIWFNQSYDEGAGVMIAGELPSNPNALYGANGGPKGSGAVDVYNNLIQANLSNDDGGGLRLLMVGNDPINVYNNMIVNNVSTHEGGGVALDDASNVRFYDNTVMKNLTTATAITSNGQPAPAGLSTAANSTQLQQTLPLTASSFSNPLMFNNIFWDNRAGTRVPNSNIITGLGLPGDNLTLAPIDSFDMGVTDTPLSLLSPTNSVLQPNPAHPVTPSATNVTTDPLVASSYDTVVAFDAWRTNVAFIGAILVSADLPPSALGDYHLTSTSPAIDNGAASKGLTNAPAVDIDNQARPMGAAHDIGADEFVAPATIGLGSLTPVDNFNRANSTDLGIGWQQKAGNTRVNSNTALATGLSTSVRTTALANGQLAGLTFPVTTPATTPAAGTALLLEASGAGGRLDKYIRVRFNGSTVVVATTTNRGSTYVNRATFPATFVAGDKFVATALANGTVSVYRVGSTTTLLGTVVIPTTGNRSWTPAPTTTQLGMQLPNGARVDDFIGRNA